MKKKTDSLEKKTYIAPDIEVVEIEVEQNILQAGSGTINDMPGEDWNQKNTASKVVNY